jgi:epoxide hydrolase-like predicted phosphatase
MSKIKAVIFDMGGVLIPSPMELWAENPINFEPNVNEKVSGEQIVETLLSNECKHHFKALECGEITIPDFEAVFTYFFNKQHGRKNETILHIFHGLQPNNKSMKLLPQWKPILEGLRSEGIKIAVLTNNFYLDRARQLSTHSLNPKYFDAIVESCRECLSKPDKKFYQKALDKIGVKASESIFIDDLGVNLKSAKEMGFKTIQVCILLKK